MLEDAIHKLLTDDADVSALVGARVYPAMVVQSPEKPYITYQRISTNRLQAVSEHTGTMRARIQCNCWSDKYKEARELANKTRLALDSFTGEVDGDVIAWILVLNERDAAVNPESAQRRATMGVQIDIAVWATEET